MAIGQNYYSDQAETDLINLARQQSGKALGYGDIAAAYADPFQGERPNYQKRLRDLVADPGSLTSSPFYQFALDQGMENINRRAAARGQRNSGNVLGELMRFGQGLASQTYFPQADLLSRLAMSGSSPASAGLSYARGTERAQDYLAQAGAEKAAGERGRVPPSSDFGQSRLSSMAAAAPGGAYSSGGFGLPYSGDSYESSYKTGGGYTPSASAGTGYMTSDYGTTNFGPGMPMGGYYTPGGGEVWDWSNFNPAAYAEQDYWGYK